MRLALEAAGYELDAVGTVEEAFARLDATSYALVIADWKLPDRDGTLVADCAAELGAATFVISGYLRQMPGGRADGHETLTKPIRASELVKVVRERIGSAPLVSDSERRQREP